MYILKIHRQLRSKKKSYTNTHTHMYIYIYIRMAKENDVHLASNGDCSHNAFK